MVHVDWMVGDKQDIEERRRHQDARVREARCPHFFTCDPMPRSRRAAQTLLYFHALNDAGLTRADFSRRGSLTTAHMKY